MPADAFVIPAGQSRRKVRDFLRREVNKLFTREFVAEWFGEDITDELMAKDLIEPARERRYSRTDDTTDGELIPGYYRLAEPGRRFASKLLLKPISRTKADELLAHLIKRARAINRNSELLYYVSSINVIGSYLTDAQILGDVDVEVEFEHKTACYQKHKEMAIARAHTLAPFRYFYLASDEQDFCRHEVYKILKDRNPYLSVLSSRVDTPDRRLIFSARRPRERKQCL